MSKKYSAEVKIMAVEAVEQRGFAPSVVVKMFSISRNALNTWRKKYHEQKIFENNRFLCGRKAKITDLVTFQQFVDENSGLTRAEMAEKLGEGMTARIVGYALKKIGYSRKKK